MPHYLSGFIVGLSQTIIGHPLDTLKVMIQNNTILDPNTSKMQILKHYYKGWTFPLFSAMTYNGLLFNSYEYLRSNDNSIIKNKNFLAGTISGLMLSPYVFFVNKCKILQQLNKPLTYKNIFNRYGIITNAIKEGTAVGIYFSGYNTLKNDYSCHPLISGGLSGLLMWTVVYPIDSIRTRQFASNISVYEAYSRGKLWVGYNVCAVRSVIINAFNFYVYEKCNQYLE